MSLCKNGTFALGYVGLFGFIQMKVSLFFSFIGQIIVSNFVIGQYIYITFQIHTGGQDGYLTTQWYANNQYIYRGSNYPVSSSSTRGYSRYAYSAAAYGAVRLYWCDQSDYSDGQLAATLTLNITLRPFCRVVMGRIGCLVHKRSV